MLSEVKTFLMLVLFPIGTGFFLKWFIAYKEEKEELKNFKARDAEKAIEYDKEKVHSKFDSESLDKLLGESVEIYGKLGPRKDI